MNVWIVLRNGKVDEVFYNEVAANAHRNALTKKWAITDIIQKEVKSL